MSHNAMLKEKLKTADEAASLVQSGHTIDVMGILQQPYVFEAALAQQKNRLEDVTVRGFISTGARPYVEVDLEQKHFKFESWHFSGYDRTKFDNGLMSYIPINLGEWPYIYSEYLKIDILIIRGAPMDELGYFNCGLLTGYLRAACDLAQKIIVETCTEMPHCHGEACSVHISEVDVVIEGDNKPLFELPNAPITEIDEAVAAQITPLIKDGACIQIGIGGMPNAVCSALAKSDVKNLGIHTEMFADGFIDLVNAGKITGAEKQTYPGKITYTFALGTKRTYDFIDNNEDCFCLPVDITNLPDNISKNDNVVSINNCVQVDLSGQVASESSGYKHISGTGGQLQFVRGAVESKGGLSFMCLSSQYIDVNGKATSRIVPGFTPGTTVTTPRTDVMYVVTEYGIVNLKGKSISERALALISIAHPDDRESLLQEARDNRIISRRYW